MKKTAKTQKNSPAKAVKKDAVKTVKKTPLKPAKKAPAKAAKNTSAKAEKKPLVKSASKSKTIVAQKSAAPKLKNTNTKEVKNQSPSNQKVDTKSKKTSALIAESKIKKEKDSLIQKKSVAKNLPPKPPVPKESKKGKKSKGNADGEEGFEDVDIEQLLKDAVPVVKKKSKTPVKVKPVEPDELEEFKRPSFNAKSLTQAIAGPPSTPPKAEPLSKVKGKFFKFELEYLVRSSVRLLYEFISTPSGLSEWFADDVNFRNDIYSFFWDKAEQKAKLIKATENKSVRFQWIDDKDIYFEFRIEVDELTGDVALIITDFAEDLLSKDAAVLLWNSQIEALLKAIGSY